jgi:hypothetical protein
MRHPMRWVLGLAAVLAVATGCEPSTAPTLPEPSGPALSLESSGYRLIESPLPEGLPAIEVSKLIGLSGGSLHLAGHSIEVPEGAVSVPTLFTLSLVTDGYVEVELTAVVSSISGSVLDVGGNGFGGSTVALTLSYAAATNVGDPDDLLILRMLKDGQVEALDVVVEPNGKRVTAQLDHFSRYCLASN